MASKAMSLLFISLVLACMGSVSIPKAEAQLKYHSCKTVADCRDIHCPFVKCVESHCQCPPTSPLSIRKSLNVKPAETPLWCKTASDCEDKLTCVFGNFVCENSQCHCLNG